MLIHVTVCDCHAEIKGYYYYYYYYCTLNFIRIVSDFVNNLLQILQYFARVHSMHNCRLWGQRSRC